MTNLLDNWEEVLAQEVKAMKKRPLPRKTARLKTFVSSLLQAQRERDAKIVSDFIRDHEGKLNFPGLKGLEDDILNQSNNEETN